MDIFSHAIAGASTGMVFQRPLTGAFFGILPDLVLSIKRVEVPPKRYRVTHSFAFVAVVFAAMHLAGSQTALCAAIALLSHLVLDLPTHGPQWAPRLFYPFSNWTFPTLGEWEWLNDSWFVGFYITCLWVTTCWSLSLIIA